MQEIIGTGVALVTPFNAQGTVDHEALARVVNYQVENGVDYLVVLGTTGESVTLSKQEKKEVIHTIQQVNDGRLPLVIGIGGNDTAVVVNELKAADLKGFVAIYLFLHLITSLHKKGFTSILKLFLKPVHCLLFCITFLEGQLLTCR